MAVIVVLPPSEHSYFNASVQGQVGNASARSETPSKTCSRCRVAKPLAGFFFRLKEGRYESQCKQCKREARLSRKAVPAPVRAGEQGPDEFIEPKRSASVEEPDRIIEPPPTRDSTKPINFTMWERLYGRALSEVECIEIRTNLTAFFGVLLNEDKKQDGMRT